MLVHIRSIIITFFAITLVSGCQHNKPFPELDGEGELVADQNNAAYENSTEDRNQKSSSAESVSQKTENNKNQSQTEEQKSKNVKKSSDSKEKMQEQNTDKTEKKESLDDPRKIIETSEEAITEPQKDLTKPDPEVEDIQESGPQYIVSERAPSVITDIDLKEMDAEDGKSTIIEPDTKTTTVIATKEVIKEEKTVSEEPSVFYLAETIYFSNGGATVDSGYYKKLRSIVKEAKQHKGKIVVQGFASSRTKNTDVITHKMANLKVSVARAENVAKLLSQFGMPKSRIVTEGLSDSRPAYQEVMPEGERLNRRAEVYISY